MDFSVLSILNFELHLNSVHQFMPFWVEISRIYKNQSFCMKSFFFFFSWVLIGHTSSL